ncbi:MAG: hypothetical protein PHX52_01750, partial [Candidatus Pacebacteria bacterium]|nr:hypothetical protein [Candidatus Paceibacterota bacterium]
NSSELLFLSCESLFLLPGKDLAVSSLKLLLRLTPKGTFSLSGKSVSVRTSLSRVTGVTRYPLDLMQEWKFGLSSF